MVTSLIDLIGKEIRLYPNDTYKKCAILLSIDSNGYMFKITDCETGSGYKPGQILFINHASKVSLILKDNNKN